MYCKIVSLHAAASTLDMLWTLLLHRGRIQMLKYRYLSTFIGGKYS